MRWLPQALTRRLPRLSARFHVAFGLSSLLSSIVLVAMFAGFVPDRERSARDAHVALSEALASAGSMLLRRGDVDGLRRALEFVVDRNTDLATITLHRTWNAQQVTFGDAAAVSAADEARTVRVPLMRANREWGELAFRFTPPTVRDGPLGLLDRARRAPFGLMLFVGLLGFPAFYFYLGRVLKQLDPKAAVPGRVRSALDSIAECLVVLDRHGNLVLANAAFAALAGRSQTDLVGVGIDTLDWLPADTDDATGLPTAQPWARAFETATAVHQASAAYTDANGRRRRFIVNCSPVQADNGQLGGLLVSMDDVTRLEEQEVALREAMRRAEEANVAKSAFLSNMSHEIRTPMTAILGFTEVLRRGNGLDESARQRHLQTIARSGDHLLELINDVLDLSKVESGAMEVEAIDTPAAAIAFEVADVLRVKAREKGIALEVEPVGALPLTITSDPARLRQVVTNLVGNAVKFTDTGGVTVRLAHDEAAGILRIDVIDTGIGMDEVQQSRIFEAFTQADASVTRRFGGTGLGLSISRKLAEALGGSITVSSVPGEGSRFTLAIPSGDVAAVERLAPDALHERLAEVAAPERRAWSFPTAKLLVVDDAAENRELLALVLGDLGLDVALACDGQEAVDHVASQPVDCVLMDIQMPVMDGYRAASRMRENGITVPLIALTANAMKGYEERVLAAGFSHYRSKPIDIDALTALLGELLGGTCEAIDAPVDDAPSDTGDSQAPIVSTLALVDPRFASIASSFLDKLGDRLVEARAALAAGDADELGAIGHWMKGSGGTMGFEALTGPASALEAAARAGDLPAVATALTAIDALAPRLRAEPAADHEPETDVTPPPSTFGESPAPSDSPLVSTLLVEDDRFRSIVERFLPRLDERLAELAIALDAGDMDKTAELAHWLKGSGGNVGFDAFTEPAQALEHAARIGGSDAARAAQAVIVRLAARVRAGLEPFERAA